ncbi:MAG: hypothetical protein DRP84_02345 [Spirochaetes bacterium]|nr:MAG: hypothetical protein DRP84_02345 [Spirochaetota bacterium]
MVFNSGKHRMNGFGLFSGWMAFGNANKNSKN